MALLMMYSSATDESDGDETRVRRKNIFLVLFNFITNWSIHEYQ